MDSGPGVGQCCVCSAAEGVLTFRQSDPAFIAQQRDLNIAAFRAVVKLFDRLELQSPDGTTGEEAAHVVSRIFVRYTNTLFKAWDLSRYDIAVRNELKGIRTTADLPCQATDDRSTDRSTVPGVGPSLGSLVTRLIMLSSCVPCNKTASFANWSSWGMPRWSAQTPKSG